jgi:hypothetical protein
VALLKKRLACSPPCPYSFAASEALRLHAIKVGSDDRVPIGMQRLQIEKPPEAKVILCLHPTGHHSVLAAAPDPKQKPVLLFTNRPK